MSEKNLEIFSPNRISFLTTDSREVQPGCGYFAVKGTNFDGRLFIKDAVELGASVVVTDSPSVPAEFTGTKTQIIVVKDIRKFLAEASCHFFEHPTRKLKLLGVTGTNGKTTTTVLLESILKSAAYNPALIGTLENRLGSWKVPSTLTTPDSIHLQGLLSDFLKKGAKSAVMEVSSHALDQSRPWGSQFAAAVFTNLTQDHLDYHKTMDAYFQAKVRLFRDYDCPIKIINTADTYGRRLHDMVKALPGRCFTFGPNESDTANPDDLTTSAYGTRGRIRTTLGEVEIESPLVGDFNKQNLVAATLCALTLNIKPTQIEQGLQAVTVPGRMERIENSQNFHVFVDYAHTPDALLKVLTTLRALLSTSSNLITVFGCGGDRDPSKRPIMGQIATTHSDKVWITSDNPRTEDPEKIIHEVMVGAKSVSSAAKIHTEANRRLAIEAALNTLKAGDILLVAGKGHETYQIIGTQKLPFDDRVVAREYLNR